MTSLIAETARRPLRSIAQMVATPLVPRDFIDLIDPLSSSHDLRGRVAAVTQETADAVTVRIRVGRGWRGHRAGQYVRIGVDVDGVRQWRTYSITSQADPKARATAHRHHRQGRPATAWCPTTWCVGRRRAPCVHLDQAAGDFVLPDPAPAKVLFVTAGSGITPVMGMLRSHSRDLGDVVLVHCARTADDVIFGDELRALAADGPPASSSGTPTAPAGSPRPNSTRWSPTWRRRADLGLRTGRAARRRSRPTGRRHGCAAACTPSGSAPRVRGRRRAAPSSSPSGHHARVRRRRHRLLDAGEEAGRADALGLPDGHLLRLRPAPARGHRARPAHRRDHHRRPRRRRAGADLRVGRGRRLPYRSITATNRINHIRTRSTANP